MKWYLTEFILLNASTIVRISTTVVYILFLTVFIVGQEILYTSTISPSFLTNGSALGHSGDFYNDLPITNCHF